MFFHRRCFRRFVIEVLHWCVADGKHLFSAILFIRVYAFSGRNEKLGVYLIVQFIVRHLDCVPSSPTLTDTLFNPKAIHGTGIALLVLFLKSAKCNAVPLVNVFCS